MMDRDEERALRQNERGSLVTESEHTVIRERPMNQVIIAVTITFWTAVFVILCLSFGGMDYISYPHA